MSLLKFYNISEIEHEKDGYFFPKFSILNFFEGNINSFYFKTDLTGVLTHQTYIQQLDYDAINKHQIKVNESTAINLIVDFATKTNYQICISKKQSIQLFSKNHIYRLQITVSNGVNSTSYYSDLFCFKESILNIIAINAKYKQSNALLANSLTKITMPENVILNGAISSEGNGHFTQTGNQLTAFANGSVYNLKFRADNVDRLLSLSEGSGYTAVCIKTKMKFALSNHLWTKQDDYHFNKEHGFTKLTDSINTGIILVPFTENKNKIYQ